LNETTPLRPASWVNTVDGENGFDDAGAAAGAAGLATGEAVTATARANRRAYLRCVRTMVISPPHRAPGSGL
jgi:hypothetical protein